MADRNVSPDSAILENLFKGAQPTSIAILLQNWDKCIFRADFPEGKESCVARIEAEDREDILPDSFTTVSALQEIARSVIPKLVPATFDVGKVCDSKGRKFQFSVVGLVEGETLEDTWEKIREGDKNSIIDEIVSAVSTLHFIKINDSLVKETFLRCFLKNTRTLGLCRVRAPLEVLQQGL